jgi:uncharacterized protein YdeI (YjbR/CyaY-like superfamily)
MMAISKRPRYLMPDFVRDALIEHSLMGAYRNRPPYQQNDYIGWINHAKREETKTKRLTQMLDELTSGDKYMKMPYKKRDS